MPLPTCVTSGCNAAPAALPVATCAVTVNDGEIDTLFISDAGVADEAAFLAALDQAGGAGNIVQLRVTGSKPAPDQASVSIGGGQSALLPRKGHSLDLICHDDADLVHEAARLSECNLPVIMWYKTNAYTYGDAADVWAGIPVTLTMNHVLGGEGTNAQYVINCTWTSKYSPSRIANFV